MPTNCYVVGLLHSYGWVVLIKKNRPEWQAGFLNGVGGHIEVGETPLNAMVREFKEETGIEIPEWRLFAEMVMKSGGRIYCFESHSPTIMALTQPSDGEEVCWYSVGAARKGELPTIPNLPWLLAMALDDDKVFAEITFNRNA